MKNRRGQVTYIYDDNIWVILARNRLGEEKTWTYDQNGPEVLFVHHQREISQHDSRLPVEQFYSNQK